MESTTIDYGIDLGTTNSAISKMENGAPISIRTNTLKDTMPSCISINRKKTIHVGDGAFNTLKDQKLSAMKNWNKDDDNAFIEFKRTMGSDASYQSVNAERDFSSIELSAEVLKTLKSFQTDEIINSIIITVPAAFKNNQVDATRTAGKEAGFEQVGIITEPEAAAWVYGLNSDNKDGFWLVFDFGGGTFDAALLKVTDGIRQIVDTEGDNYLGGKNLDDAIVDEIIIPHLKSNFVVDELLQDNTKSIILRDAMKFYAEDIKKQISFNEEASILTNIGDLGNDDLGDELELDFTVTEAELEKVIGPVFQKSIDISNKLLRRNNLDGGKLTALILVGGPTYSPILRRMLGKQICKPDTSVDPMTVVSKGAAIYASTIKKNIESIEIDKTKIQLEISHEATSVEVEEFITIKILDEITEGIIPEKVFANISRNDGGWSSGKLGINNIGEILPVQLVKGKQNVFTVILYDDKGNLLECEPSNFKIISGSKGGNAVLPYNVGIEIQDYNSGKLQFRVVPGLSKSKQLPASGALSNLKTPSQIRPGMEEDYLEISIYQGEHNSNGTRAVHNHHVNTIYITGNDLPELLPEDSEVDIELKIDINQAVTGLATFPHIAFTYEFSCDTKIDKVDSENIHYLEKEIYKAKSDIESLKSKNINSDELNDAVKEIFEIESHFNKNKESADTQQQTIANLRKILKVVDKIMDSLEWPELESQLKEAFYELEEVNKKKGNAKTSEMVEGFRKDVEQAINQENKKDTPALIENIRNFSFEIERLEHLIGFLFFVDGDFENIPWRDSRSARTAIERGKTVIYESPSIDKLQPIVNDVYDNAGFSKGGKPGGLDVPKGILRG